MVILADSWPNRESQSNSDGWLVENHGRLVQMRPKVLILNFVRGWPEEAARRKALQLVEALAEGSRWHGYRDPAAPAFLRYEIAGVLDATEPAGRLDLNSALFPRGADGIGFDYAPLFDWKLIHGLNLEALVERGLVHEVWFFAQHTQNSAAWETVEVKQCYDEGFRKLGHTPEAGNSGAHRAPWIGRSLRILFFNFERGVGCALESLSHSLEHMATCGAIPYFRRYFTEYAMLDLDRRFGLPFDSLYARGGADVEHPEPGTLPWRWHGKAHRLKNYVVAGGNVHFLPNGRRDYDLDNAAPALSTIESWRQPDERPAPWTPAALDRYRSLAPDCMGRWLVYWRQNLPGLGNTALDEEGQPMKNWWPFLFY